MNMASLEHSVPEAIKLLAGYRPTGLQEFPELARLAHVARVYIKLENERPLGNFKFLGGMIAGIRALAHEMQSRTRSRALRASSSPRLICASDGNHGLSVAAAAQSAGVPASIYLPASVSATRAQRITAIDGEIVWINGSYDDAVTAAVAAAARGEGILVPDTTSDSDNAIVRDVMAGYGVIAEEIVFRFDDVEERPSHLFIQAGVGGLAAAVAEGCLAMMRHPRKLLTVEPERAACVAAALRAGQAVRIAGNLKTCAEMLSCGVASVPALEILLRHHAQPLLVPEDQLLSAVTLLARSGGPATTPSGAAGLAGLMHVAMRCELRMQHALDAKSRVLLIVTEGRAE